MAALVVVASLPAAAADSTSYALPDVPWTPPTRALSADSAATAAHATTADTATAATTASTLGNMPTCGADQALTVGAGGALSCVAMSSGSSTVEPCSTTATLAGGTKTHAQCCAMGGIVTLAGTAAVCQINAASCPGGWSKYQNWSVTQAVTCQPGCVGIVSCTTSSHAWSNKPPETCSYTPYSGTYYDDQGYHCISSGNPGAICYAANIAVACN